MTDRLKALYDNARTKSFQYNGAKITVREELLVDRTDMPTYRQYIIDKLSEERLSDNPKKSKDQITFEILGGIDFPRIITFVLFVIRAKNITGKMPADFKLPKSTDSEDVWYDAYWQFLQLPIDLYNLWNDALIAVNKPEPDPEVLPGDK